MGRKKIYLTIDEAKAANSAKRMRYYEKNKEKLRIQNLENYYKRKLRSINDNIQDNELD